MSMYYVVVIVMTVTYAMISQKKTTQKDSAFMEIIVLEVFKS